MVYIRSFKTIGTIGTVREFSLQPEHNRSGFSLGELMAGFCRIRRCGPPWRSWNLHKLDSISSRYVKYGNYMDNVPALQLDPNSWTKVANIIYLDAPTLTGYSYTKTPEAVHFSDTASASQTAEFMRKFVKAHPKFLKNPMYVTGISYSGIIIPMITEELYKGNDEGLEPIVNIQGYMAGNPLTDKSGDINSRLEYAYRVALISKELYEATKRDCNDNYAEADSNNVQCMLDIDEVNKRAGAINIQQILDPDCDPATNLVKSGNPIIMDNQESLNAGIIQMLPSRTSRTSRTYLYGRKDPEVQKLQSKVEDLENHMKAHLQAMEKQIVERVEKQWLRSLKRK